MAQMQTTILCLVIAVGSANADDKGNQLRSLLTQRTAGADHDDPQIHPPLDPKSHRVFYKNDYPDNEQPRTIKEYNFKHPYPQVQQDNIYDKDYVKDENADSGEWQAQMEYDTLRNRIRKLRDGVNDYETWANKAKKEMDEAEKNWKKAQDAVDAAKGDQKKAEEEFGEASGKVEDLTGESYEDSLKGGNGTVGGQIGEAMDKVKKEMKLFEECKEELEKTRNKLHKLLDEHEDQLQAKAEAEAEAAEAARLEAEEKAEREKEEHKYEEEEEEAEEAQKSRAQLEKELSETEAELDKAAAKLREVRGDKAPKAKDEKAAATFSLPSATVLLMVFATAVGTGNHGLLI